MAKEYDYLLKVLLVGDSDVGKTEILNNLDEDPMNEEGEKNKKHKFVKISNFTSVSATYKTTIILLDGKRVKLQVSLRYLNLISCIPLQILQFAKTRQIHH